MVANTSKDRTKTANEGAAVTLDDAMLHTGIGLYNVVHTLLSGMILMGVIMHCLMLGYVLPAAQCDLDLSMAQRGWLSALPFIAITLTAHLWGWLADTRGRKPIMQISMVVSSFLSILASFSPNIFILAILQVLSSLFMSGSSAVVYVYLGECNNLQHKDKMVAFGSAFVGIGTIILPGLAWLIFIFDFSYPITFLDIHYRPWRLLIVACTIPYIIGSIFLVFAPESPKFLIATGQQQACLDVVKKIYSINKMKSADNFPVTTIIPEGSSYESGTGLHGLLVSMRDQTVPLFRMPLLPWTCLICFVQFGIFATTNGFYVWIPTILNALANHDGGPTKICDIIDASRAAARNQTEGLCDDTLKMDTFERSIYIGLVFCLMYFIVGFLVDCVGKKLILIVILGGSGLCGIAAHLINDQQIGIVLFALFQMSGACIGLMNAVTVDLFPTKYRAMALCLSMMMGRAGSVIASNLIGLFLDVNCGIGFYLFGGLLIACSALTFTLPGQAKKREETTIKPTEEEAQATL